MKIDYAKGLRMARKEFNLYGILCLTSKPNNFLMWSHYADCHRGFVLGYDKFKLWDSDSMSMSPVIHSEELPEFGIYEDLMKKSIKSLHTKSTCWGYEDEYRLITSRSKFAKILDPSVVREIILGASMSFENDMEIIAIAKEMYSHAKVFKCKLSTERFEVITAQVM